jgi:hypothetical protein
VESGIATVSNVLKEHWNPACELHFNLEFKCFKNSLTRELLKTEEVGWVGSHP